MIKYIHKKASIFIFQFISDITCFIQKSIYHTAIIISYYTIYIQQSRKFTIPLGSPDPRLLLTGFLQLVLAQSEGSYKRQIPQD